MQRQTYLVKRVDFYRGLGDTGKRTLGTLAGTTETAKSTGVLRDIVLGFPLELILEVVQQGVVEVLTTQMGVASGRLDGENTSADVEQRNIESSSTQIEDQDVFLSF